MHAQPAAVQQSRHQRKQALRPGDLVEHATHLLRREDHRQALPAPCPHRVELAQVDLQNVAVEEEQGVEGLILCASRNPPLSSEMPKKLLDLRRSHRSRVAYPMEQNETPRPLRVAILGATGIMPHTQP
jgi:hypothetical protein